MTLDDLHYHLETDPDINFLAYVVIPLHAVGVSAAIRSLVEQGIQLKGYVIITAHPLTGRTVKKENFYFEAPGVQIVDGAFTTKEQRGTLKKLKERFTALKEAKKKRERKLYFVGPDLYAFPYVLVDHETRGSSVSPILIDNGAASYDKFLYQYLSMARFNCVQKPFLQKAVSFAGALVNGVFATRVYHSTKRKGNLIDFRIFFQDQGLHPNRDAVAYYDQVFAQMGMDNYNQQWDIMKGCVLINTQPLVECQMTDGIVDVQFYGKVMREITQYTDNVVIKPHPREQDIEKYCDLGCVVLRDNSVTQEAMLAALNQKPSYVISIFSSTLLNANSIFGIPAISLAKLFEKENITKPLKKQLRKYCKDYKGIIQFPETFEELVKLLQMHQSL